MIRDEEHAELMSAAEALLFVSDEPVSSAKLASILEEDPGRMDETLALLAAEYADENRGVQLREVAGGWRLFTHPAFHDVIERYVISWDTRRLSQAALEALAVIAYHQPVTRAGVNAIRGVNSEGVIASLVEKGFVRERGRDAGPGNAILYGTTRLFLEKFGLKSLKDLPPLEDFAPDEESRELIRERLSGAVARREEGQMSLDTAEDDADDAPDVMFRVADETGAQVVEEVDRGEDEREDDPEAMADILSQSMTEKVDFDVIGDDDDDDDLEEILTIE